MRHMARRFTSLLLVVWGILCLTGCVAVSGAGAFSQEQTHDLRRMAFPPVAFSPPRADRIVLSNGMILYLLEDHELPLITVDVVVKTGSIYEPEEKIGLAGITGTVMRTGGTATLSGDQMDEELEYLAAFLETSIGEDAGFASLDVLAKDIDRGLTLLAGVLMHPAFPEEKVDLAKKQAVEAIRRRNDSPSSLASREFRKLLYGPRHPFARESTIETVGRMTRDDLAEFHTRYYHPNNVIMGVTGDFIKGEIVDKIQKAFSGWEPAEATFPPVPPVKREFSGSVNYVFKDVSQTHLRLGHIGVKKDNPDYFALSVMNDMLGAGSFTNRLFREVRSRRGLAYAVGSVLSPGNLDLGIFYAYSQTRSESTSKTILAIMAQLRRIREEKVSDEELQLAKDSFLNSFIFSFSNPSQIVSHRMTLEYYGLPEDFLERFRDSVAKVTKEDIRRVAEKYIRPGSLTILAVGREKDFDKPLSAFGKVHIISLEKIAER